MHNAPEHSTDFRPRASVTLRPVGPGDFEQLAGLVASLSADDRRWRFRGAVNGLTPSRLQSLVMQDADTLALVATAGGALIADVRCVTDSTGSAAEFGLMVTPAWRRRGVGTQCMAALAVAASRRGLRWLYGTVMAENAPMLRFMLGAGFLCSRSRHDADLVVVERCIEHDAEDAGLMAAPAAADHYCIARTRARG